jgi:ferritin-like protein
MTMASESLHEDPAKLGLETIDRHRAIVSLMEELEAVDWYDQRCKATEDDELRAILAHNRDEEKEHAAMVLEWLRRRDPALDRQLRTYLFRTGPIHDANAVETGTMPAANAGGSLGIGSLRATKGVHDEPSVS